MIQKSEAILLKRQDLRETSLLLRFYTKASGRIQGVMKGVRGERGHYGSSPQLFGLYELVFYERRDRDIFTVSQCELKEFFGEIRENLEKTSHAMYFIELADSLTPLNDKSEAMFALLENSLRMLCGPASAKRSARIFEIKLLDILGLMPRLKNCAICGATVKERPRFSLKNGGVICEACGEREREGMLVLAGTINFIEHIHRADWATAGRIKVSRDVGRQVEGLLRNFMDYHLHIRPRTIDFMKKVMV